MVNMKLSCGIFATSHFHVCEESRGLPSHGPEEHDLARILSTVFALFFF